MVNRGITGTSCGVVIPSIGMQQYYCNIAALLLHKPLKLSPSHPGRHMTPTKRDERKITRKNNKDIQCAMATNRR